MQCRRSDSPSLGDALLLCTASQHKEGMSVEDCLTVFTTLAGTEYSRCLRTVRVGASRFLRVAPQFAAGASRLGGLE